MHTDITHQKLHRNLSQENLYSCFLDSLIAIARLCVDRKNHVTYQEAYYR